MAYVPPASWLAANADRERAVDVLRAAFTEGRLTHDEFDERIARAYASRTYGELGELTADLPAGPDPLVHVGQPRTEPDPAPRRRAAMGGLILTAISVFLLAAFITGVAVSLHHTHPAVHQGPQFAQLPRTELLPHVTPIHGQ